MRSNERRGGTAWAAGILLVLALTGAACKKAPVADRTTNVTIVAIPEAGVRADGGLSPDGLAKVEAQGAATSVSVTFFRSRVGDAALAQLGQFANVKRIEAPGSRITRAGVEKFKATNPDVEVTY